MAHLKKRGNILWIKYYDRLLGTSKEFSTKIEATKDGWVEARKLLKQFEAKHELNESFVEYVPSILFSDGIEEYLSIRIIKPKTKEMYKLAGKTFISICGDRNVNLYQTNDYKRLLVEFDKRGLSQNSKGIYTAHLHAIFQYLKDSSYVKENIIKTISRKPKLPESIDDGDLIVILEHLKKRSTDQYNLILFLLITGFRISTALALDWKNVDWKNGFIVTPNVKRGREFFFPLTDDIAMLLEMIGVKKEGRIFNYTEDGLKFFSRAQKRLINDPNGAMINKLYTLHQLRKTFITKLLEKNVPIHIVKTLADHTDIKTTMNYYASVNIKKIGQDLNSLKVFGDIFGGNKRLIG